MRLAGRRSGGRAGLGLAAALAVVGVLCGPACSRATGERFNVVLLTLDTVRADRLGCYGGPATAALDSLARDGARFDQATAAVPLTLPSHATILTGLLPPGHGLRNNGAGALPANVPTLATRLSEAGYRTGAFVGAFVLDHRFGLARGFDRYDDEIDRGGTSGADALEAERRGDLVVDRALAWLGEQRGGAHPYFLWVHLFDAHAPYEPPEPYRRSFPGRAYEGEIAFVDAQVARVLAAIDARGETSRTVVIAVADHGEALGEHGEQTHGLLLYQPTLRVPLLVRAPGIVPAGSVVREPISLADLAPTLGSLVGVAFQGAALDGRDLSPAMARGAEPARGDVYSETEYPRLFGWSGMAALRRGPIKHVSAPRAETFDLERDPGERSPLPGDSPDGRDMEARIARVRERSTATGSATLDADTRERLASLGYVGGAPAAGSTWEGADPKDRTGQFHDFEEAHRALRAGELHEAARTLERLVREDERNAVFRSSLAQAERRRGNLARSIALHSEVVALRPDDTGARYELALALQDAGRLEEATAALEEAIRRSPAFPEAHNALGISLAARGRIDQALEQFDRAIALDGRDSRAHNNRGNALRDAGRLAEAGEAYARAIDIDPRYADPHTGLGAVALALDRPAQALAEFDRALALAPGQHEILVNRGIALELLGRAADAREAYRSFLARAGDAPAYAPARQATRQLLARLDAASSPADLR